MESTLPKTFDEICEYHQLTEKEKETVKPILAKLNGYSILEAKELLNFCEMVISNFNIVSVDVEE